MDRATFELGTTTAVVSAPIEEKVGWIRRRLVSRDVEYLEWTIDGVPLRELAAWPNGEVAGEVTPIRNGNADREYEADFLRAVLGEPVRRDWTLMPDGRVPLLVCHVDFDLDCRALTAEIVRDDTTVVWRDIAWQAAYEPIDLTEQKMPVLTLGFEQNQYDDLVHHMLDDALEVNE